MAESTEEKRNWFWKYSGLGTVATVVGDVTDVVLGKGDKLDAIQKKVIKGVWDGIAKGIGDVTPALRTAGVRVLKGFDIPEADARRMMDAVLSAAPDIPVVKQLLVIVSYVYFMFTTLVKGTTSGGELIDKHFRRILQPGVGSYPDWLTAVWRGLDIEKLAQMGNETGLSPEWREVMQTATQWWPDIPFVQEMFRRGHVTESEYHNLITSTGVRDSGLFDSVRKMAWNVVPINTVLELFRRSGLDKHTIKPLLEAVGFANENAEYVLDAATRLIEEPTLFELRRRGIINDKEYRDRLSMFGYKEADLDSMTQMHRVLPDMFQLRNMYFRGFMNKREYIKWLGMLGYDDKDADNLEKAGWQLPGPADLMRFGVREVFTPAIAARFGQYQQYPRGITEWANKIGMSEEIAQMYWAAHWDLPAIGQMFSMFHRGIINRADLKMGVRARDVMPFWQDKVIDLSYRLIPRRTLPRMVRQDLIDFRGLVSRFQKLGFNPADSAIMARSAEMSAVEEQKDLTRSDIVNAMRYSWYTTPQAITALQSLGYKKTAVDFYIADGERRKALEDAREAATDISKETSEAVDLSTSEVLRGYSQGMVDGPKTTELLSALGIAPTAITFKMTLSDLRRILAHKEHAAKQYKRLFDKHLLTPTEAQTSLAQAGYTSTEIDLLVGEWTLERNADDAIAGIQDRLPTITDLEKWLKLGILTVEEWVAYMRLHRYPEPVITMNLEEILLTQEA